MPNCNFIAHNPATVWQVPDAFRSVYSHAAESIGGGVVKLGSDDQRRRRLTDRAHSAAPQEKRRRRRVSKKMSVATTSSIYRRIRVCTRKARKVSAQRHSTCPFTSSRHAG